jgi:hypothetical protein
LEDERGEGNAKGEAVSATALAAEAAIPEMTEMTGVHFLTSIITYPANLNNFPFLYDRID